MANGSLGKWLVYILLLGMGIGVLIWLLSRKEEQWNWAKWLDQWFYELVTKPLTTIKKPWVVPEVTARVKTAKEVEAILAVPVYNPEIMSSFSEAETSVYVWQEEGKPPIYIYSPELYEAEALLAAKGG